MEKDSEEMIVSNVGKINPKRHIYDVIHFYYK